MCNGCLWPLSSQDLDIANVQAIRASITFIIKMKRADCSASLFQIYIPDRKNALRKRENPNKNTIPTVDPL